ncbi:hypothetical protein PRZ48_002446 [Zasmidium cellare]|uniref:cellulase n=1 Tax=Zasmidium cellare TaxID=395010 RepID=A0ABR0F415_ZASCE|nr:hypothetical protein PRZ48_002446 [Zasmidium cellare]
MRLTTPIVTTLAVCLATATHSHRKRMNKMVFAGINESGPEFGETTFPGTYGTDYTWPNLSTIDTFISQGLNTFRINVLMERLVPDQMTGSLDEAYLGNLTETVEYITGKSTNKSGDYYALIAPHNFGRYYGEVINSTDDFGAFWKTVAGAFKDNPYVVFDTNNEYHDMPGALVAQLNQAAIDGIRAAGAGSQYIAVEGNAYTGAWTWTTAQGTDGKTNAETMGNLTDPSNKILYEMHQYLDEDGSGTSEICVSETIGRERLEAATQWLIDNNKSGLLGEYAGGVNPTCQAAIEDMLTLIDRNNMVWKGALWWAAGPWWADYMFSVEPTDGPAYDTYVPIMKRFH